MISAAIARFGLVEIIRLFYHRPRPFLALPQIHALFMDTEWSFPSGHASFFFAMAMANYLYNKKWGVVFYSDNHRNGKSRRGGRTLPHRHFSRIGRRGLRSIGCAVYSRKI